MPFVKDDPRINREGRPLGSRDKSHLVAETWSARLDTVWDELKPETKANICCRIFCALVGRQQFHLTPEESVKNATAVMALVQRMEKALGVNVAVGSGRSDTRSVEDGTPSVQAIEAPRQGV